ncbi:putative membrane protein required for spore maturation [Clostridium sp. CAG:273]|jgi:spore maturation protein A|nr:nucleoside recognition domain-containing protein [Clostridia bacterium]CDE82830.1 putative membrane protein required for spore maturation [Clostridium sp. CAG:273]
MLNVIWPIFIIISVIYAFLCGNIENVSNGIFSSLNDVIDLSLTLLGTMCLWNGIMEIARNTSFVDRLCKMLNPLIKILFPRLENEKAKREISMNIVANFLGLGNAATPLGLKAMKTLQEDNKIKDTLNNYMVMFIVLNTASLQLIPTNVIAIRNSLGSNSPSGIIFPVWIATIIAAIVGITATKILINLSNKK